MRVEEAVAGEAAQTGPGHEYVRVGKDMSGHGFLAAMAVTTRAPELSVERIEPFYFGTEDVVVTFNGLQCEGGVQRLEDHLQTVGHQV